MENWELIGTEKNTFDKKESPLLHDFKVKVKSKRVKYIKIIAENSGTCPDWHLGAGGASWLFADEIVVK